MLHFETVEPTTLAVLKRLSALPELADFQLVGGTSLSLQIGHRVSVDLDFFTPNFDFDEKHLLRVFQSLGETVVFTTNQNWLGVKFEGVKIDVLKYPYPVIGEVVRVDELRLISKSDIAAMKLSAISSRGAKKDFIDLYFLLQEFSIDEMLNFYTQKFGIHEHFHVLRSLTYFEDAEDEAIPKILKPVSWSKVKSTIEKSVRKYVI